MLTDIFAYRYLDQLIWAQYTEMEQRLLNQAFGIVKDALPYYTSEGKENEKNKDKASRQNKLSVYVFGRMV